MYTVLLQWNKNYIIWQRNDDDHYCPLLIKKINTATTYHGHGLTITITKQCGGTQVTFGSGLDVQQS